MPGNNVCVCVIMVIQSSSNAVKMKAPSGKDYCRRNSHFSVLRILA